MPVRWGPFVDVAATLAAGAAGATMASPLFAIYEARWAIRHSDVALIYVAYMCGVLFALMFLGRGADRVGAVRMVRIGGWLLVAGLLLSALAPGMAMLVPVRVLIGVASGIMTSAATLALFRLEPPPGGRAALVASATTMAGFSFGPILCGLVAQFAPWLLVTPYLALLGVVAILLLRLPSSAPGPSGASAAGASQPGFRSLMPHLTLPGRNHVAGFLVAAMAAFSAYALFSLLATLAPSFLPLITSWHGPAISGLSVGLVLVCSALVQLPARRLSPRPCLRIALLLMLVGALVMAAAMRAGRVDLFLLAELSIGSGHGLAFLAGMTLIGLIAPGAQRAGVLSTHLCVAYLGTILPVLGVGRLADRIGLGPAVILFCTTFAALCLALFVALPLVGMPRRDADAPS